MVSLAIYSAQALHSSELWEKVAGAWALTRLGLIGKLPQEIARPIVEKLLEIWVGEECEDVILQVSWALLRMPLIPPQIVRLPTKLDVSFKAKATGDSHRRWVVHAADLIARFYACSGLASELVLDIGVWPKPGEWFLGDVPRGLRELLGLLGEAGEAVLRDLEEGLRSEPVLYS